MKRYARTHSGFVGIVYSYDDGPNQDTVYLVDIDYLVSPDDFNFTDSNTDAISFNKSDIESTTDNFMDYALSPTVALIAQFNKTDSIAEGVHLNINNLR